MEVTEDDDLRPLLILRECDSCKGSDAALLSRKMDNERTVLMTHWFRCVKLPNDVLTENHPFRHLFAAEHPPHVFLCDRDGTDELTFDGAQSQRDLWKAMKTVLARHYSGDPDRAVKGLRKLLNRYDFLDAQKDEYLARLDDDLVKHGPKSSKVKKLRRKLESLAADRKKVDEEREKLFDLGLKAETATAGGSR